MPPSMTSSSGHAPPSTSRPPRTLRNVPRRREASGRLDSHPVVPRQVPCLGRYLRGHACPKPPLLHITKLRSGGSSSRIQEEEALRSHSPPVHVLSLCRRNSG